MAPINTRIASARPQIPQAQPGLLSKVWSAVKEAVTGGPTPALRRATPGQDTFQRSPSIAVNQPRRLNGVEFGRGANRGPNAVRAVPDHLLLAELDKMKNGAYDSIIS